MRRRVVITGMGCVTPLGNEVETVWDSLVRGISGAGPITLFDASRFPTRIAAEVKDWPQHDMFGDDLPWEMHSRQTQFALASAVSAVRSSGLDVNRIDRSLMGVYLGCGEVFPDFNRFCRSSIAGQQGDTWNNDSLCEGSHGRSAGEDIRLDPGAAAAALAGWFEATGPNANFTAACVSSSKAVGEAAEVIRRGDADTMLAGGTHSMIHPFGLTGFSHLSTLSTRNDDPQGAMRPFDRNRDGFVIGEGGAVLVLEELEHARRRGAQVLAEFAGWGATHDAYRITDLAPDGEVAARAMSLAIADAGIVPEQIDYINAHGSATAINDQAETLATKRALGSCAFHVPISSTKSMTGHLTTACGGFEAMCCVLAIRNQVAPPTINYETPDPDCDLDYVPNEARDVNCRFAMTNNFGFGGLNVSLLFSAFRD